MFCFIKALVGFVLKPENKCFFYDKAFKNIVHNVFWCI